MSRVAKAPVQIPAGVEVKLSAEKLPSKANKVSSSLMSMPMLKFNKTALC